LLNIKIIPFTTPGHQHQPPQHRKSGSSIPVLLIYKNLFNINSIINERCISIKLVQLTDRVIEIRHTGFGGDTGDDFGNPSFRTDVLQNFYHPSPSKQRPQSIPGSPACANDVALPGFNLTEISVSPMSFAWTGEDNDFAFN
jgi:hypothetical protein